MTRMEKMGEGWGSWKWTCNFCGLQKFGTYTRVRTHLLSITRKGITCCKKVSLEIITGMKKFEREVVKRLLVLQHKQVPLSTSGISLEPSLSLHEPRVLEHLNKRKSMDSPIVRVFDMQTRAQLDAEIVRMFYTGGLPFNLARNLYYLSSYSFTANYPLGGYVSSGYNKLRTTLLQQEKANVEKLLEPIKNT